MRFYLVPENLDLSQFTYPEETARFLHMLINRRFLSNLRSNRHYWKIKYNIFYADRWVTIPSRTLKSIHANYRLFIGELIEHGVITRSYYSPEEHKAYGYQFTEFYRNAMMKFVPRAPVDPVRLDKSLLKMREEKRKTLEKLSPGYALAFDCLNGISLDCNKTDIDRIMRKFHKEEEAKQKEASQQENQNAKKLKKDMQPFRAIHRCNHLFFKLAEIIEGRRERYVPFYKIDDYGRFHYFLTNLPKSLRRFVRLNGNNVTGYDITSSQCIFFAFAVRDEAHGRVKARNRDEEHDCDETHDRDEVHDPDEVHRRDKINFHLILNEIERIRPQFLRHNEAFLRNELKALGKESWDQVSFALLRRHRHRQLDAEIKMLFEVLSGDFYQFMMERAGIKWETEKEFQEKRKKFKNKFFEFLYGSNKTRSRIFKAFQRTFPYITLVLWKMKDLAGLYSREREIRNERFLQGETLPDKRKESSAVWKQLKKEARTNKKWYVQLPLRMQREEAEFMFGNIAPKIGRAFLPVHDCILVEKTKRRNVKDVQKLLEREFRKLGIRADIKEKDW